MTNWITAGGLPPFPRDGIYLPKLIYSTAGQRLLSFRELLSPEWRARSYTAENLADNAAHFVDNTPEEINEIVLEMLERIEGRWPPVPAENDLQEKFAALVPGVSPQGVTRVGSGFLHRHLALL